MKSEEARFRKAKKYPHRRTATGVRYIFNRLFRYQEKKQHRVLIGSEEKTSITRGYE